MFKTITILLASLLLYGCGDAPQKSQIPARPAVAAQSYGVCQDRVDQIKNVVGVKPDTEYYYHEAMEGVTYYALELVYVKDGATYWFTWEDDSPKCQVDSYLY